VKQQSVGGLGADEEVLDRWQKPLLQARRVAATPRPRIHIRLSGSRLQKRDGRASPRVSIFHAGSAEHSSPRPPTSHPPPLNTAPPQSQMSFLSAWAVPQTHVAKASPHSPQVPPDDAILFGAYDARDSLSLGSSRILCSGSKSGHSHGQVPNLNYCGANINTAASPLLRVCVRVCVCQHDDCGKQHPSDF
jgi:hypothetical protein